MKRIIIVGGGASGLVAAIYAKNKDSEVIILERNESCAKKILRTGNGKCNYYNEDQNLKYYNSNNKELLSEILTPNSQTEIVKFFNQLGIVPKIKNGYYYPNSNQASSIKEALLIKARLLGIQIKCNVLVQEIIKVKKEFVILTNDGKIQADKVILATGSKAAPKTGSDGMGYEIAKSFGHSIIDVVPALVQLRAEEDYLSIWDGVRSDVKLSLLEDNVLVQEEEGEIQLTDYGISGICTFNISSLACRGLNSNKSEVVRIDFLPLITMENYREFIAYFDERAELLTNQNMTQILQGMLNQKLVTVILRKSDINPNTIWNELETTQKKSLYQNLKLFELPITGFNSFERAQVCSGGIPLTEINPLTMESKEEKGLYLIGELLDVDGFCGGYNLTFAWTSGMLAGKGASFRD